MRFERGLRLDRRLPFFAALGPCIVAMEACGSAHFWWARLPSLAVRVGGYHRRDRAERTRSHPKLFRPERPASVHRAENPPGCSGAGPPSSAPQTPHASPRPAKTITPKTPATGEPSTHDAASIRLRSAEKLLYRNRDQCGRSDPERNCKSPAAASAGFLLRLLFGFERVDDFCAALDQLRRLFQGGG